MYFGVAIQMRSTEQSFTVESFIMLLKVVQLPSP